MKTHRCIIVGGTLGVILLLFTGCTKLKEESPTATPGILKTHPAGWSDTTSPNFHGLAIRQAGWDMRPCKTCHGAEYGGGIANVSCEECHTAGGGPENCTTCHGGVNNAPPADLNRDYVSSARGVGAHQSHVLAGKVSAPNALMCSQCHVVPGAVYLPGHFSQSGRAMLTFNLDLAALVTGSGTFIPHPSYDATALKCSNTFCHGNWKLRVSDSPNSFAYSDSVMVGNNYSPIWTGNSSQDTCGTCHGHPPTGHVDLGTECFGCHYNGTKMDLTKHMNGKVDVFGTERNF